MIRKALTYLLVLIFSLFVIRALLYKGLRINKSGVFEKYNTMFGKENSYDVLFMGSSRCETAFDPRLFDSITGRNSYNIGVTGATPRIAFKVLKAYCSKSKLPGFLVFDVDFHFLKYGVDTVRHFPRYFPFLSNKVLLTEFSDLDPRFTSFRLNPFHSLPYSNFRLISASLHGWLGSPGLYDTCYYKGFENKIFIDHSGNFTPHPSYAFIHPQERRYLDSIFTFCRQNQVKLLMVSSPMFRGGEPEVINKSQMIRQLEAIAAINGSSYHDLSTAPFSSDTSAFTDLYHLKGWAARKFTRDFAHSFSQYFDKKTVR